MVDPAVSTLAPKVEKPEVAAPPPASTPASYANASREFLFDSIARESIGGEKGGHAAPLRTAFTVLLWAGYLIAIVVALALVWSAARELL